MARSAGNKLPTNVIMRQSAAALENIAGSAGFTPASSDSNARPAANAAPIPAVIPIAARVSPSPKIIRRISPGFAPQRHSHSDLLRAARYRKTQQAVDSYPGQCKRDQREGREGGRLHFARLRFAATISVRVRTSDTGCSGSTSRMMRRSDGASAVESIVERTTMSFGAYQVSQLSGTCWSGR